ncbi:MAG: CheR family methyltransferase [Hyphomicrobiaceae bacterium]|nr:CheR family methyltransferase [Hyphomicrobiaceae bacterium]
MGAAAAFEYEPEYVGDRLSKRNFDRLARIIQEYSGIRMPQTKTTMLEGRLRRRVRATGHASLDSYCRYLFDEGGIDHEFLHLIDVVTTNKTDFFREPAHFAYLRETILPKLAARGTRGVRAWSAACSIGAEPYTLAMVLEEFSEQTAIDYKILATDLSTDVLATALKGIYNAEMIEPVPRPYASRYVLSALNPGARKVRIHPKLRSRVAFARLNLMSDNYPVGDPMDLIFCRNVLIYFDKPTQQQVLRRLCDCLVPGGHLFVGHSETVSNFDLPVEQVAGTILMKR